MTDAPERIWWNGVRGEGGYVSTVKFAGGLGYVRDIATLTEQLEAARHDADEAEAYAEELAKDQVDLCRQLIAAEDKLAKAMELVTFASNMDVTDWSEALDVKDQARTTLAEIEGTNAP